MGDTGLRRDTRDISDRMRVHEAKSQMSKQGADKKSYTLEWLEINIQRHSSYQMLDAKSPLTLLAP